jgi:hypothetical protein
MTPELSSEQQRPGWWRYEVSRERARRDAVLTLQRWRVSRQADWYGTLEPQRLTGALSGREAWQE